MTMMQTLFILAFFLLGQVYYTTAEKVGICPPAPAYGPCVITCGADEDCDTNGKCCSNGCGAWCSKPTCPQGQTKVDCPSSLCNYVGCPGKSQESLRCSVDFCNKCKVSFYNVSTGDLVDCGPVETMCPRMLAATKRPLLGQYKPKCDANGAFEQIQCHEGYCFCVDKRGIPDMSTSVRGNPKCPEKTLCQQQVEEANKLPPIGRFVPRCKQDGSFQEKQCHASTGQCWCVDSHGREWFGTRSRGNTQDCTVSVCPADVAQLKCDPVICHTAKCPGYEKAVCRVNPCGQCKPEFLDQYNRKIQCLTKCQSLRNEALGIGKTGNASVMPSVGRYVPQCNTDGKFQQIQCYGSTGYCWCVDNFGSPVLGTIVRGKPHCKSSDVGVCPPGRPMYTCLRDLCKWSSCPAYPNAKCRVNPCGTCKAEYLDGSGNVIKDCNKETKLCQQERAKALQAGPGGLQPIGRFVPECEVSGSYKRIQCWGSVGFCWCVNDNGTEVAGTRVRGRPDCATVSVKAVKDGFCPFKQPRDAKFCSSAKKCTSDGDCADKDKCCNSTCGTICQAPIITACPNGRPFLLCLHMCNFARCPGNPKAQCFSDPCRMCRVEFRDSNGKAVDCSQGLTPCQLRRQRAMGLLGAFRPLCDAQGNYEFIQQHEGYYWCVDNKGRELNGTRIRFTKPTCPNVGQSSMSLCQLQSQKTAGARPLVGRYTPQCQRNGSFSQIQCHPSTGYCWCVNITSGVIVANTQIRGKPDCIRASACSPVLCLMYCEHGFVKDQFGCEICRCASAPSKPGFCLQSNPQQVGACVESCKQDNDCAGSSKCCSNGCGHVCTSAVLRAKPGVCPHRRIDHVGVCMNKCGDDADCQGDQKCCSNGCGRECSAPIRKACPYGQPLVMCLINPCQNTECFANPKATCRPNYCGGCKAEFFDDNNKVVNCTSGLTLCQRKYLQMTSKGHLIGAFIPQCDKNGAFSTTQCDGSTGYCWCVDPNTGHKIKNTDKGPGQGVPSCNATSVTGPTCSLKKKFSLCEGSLCKTSNCTRYPRARCVVPMGTCANACMAKYYDYDGSEVQCRTECEQKSYEATQGGLLGAYKPTCNQDGTYTLVQCHTSTGYCWCSSPDGKEWPGTRARGQPKCLRSRSELKINKVHVKLTFKKDFQLVNESLKEFVTVLKSQLSQRLGIKQEQITELSVKSGSIVVEFYVVPAEGGKDISEFAQLIYNEVRREDIVVTYGGTKFVASPQQVQASSNYLTKDQPKKEGGLGATPIALICVFLALTVVIAAVIVVIVKKRKVRSRSDTDDQSGFLYKDGRAESYSTTAAPPLA